MKKDFGYPFGLVECGDPAKVSEVFASCGGDCETVGGIEAAHPFCNPGWEAKVAEAKGRVIANPVLVSNGWIALVEYQ